jgi:hypothetical protein
MYKLTELTESGSYIMTDGQSASLSWNKAPIWDLQPNLYYCQTVAGLLIWGALADERTGLSFTIAAGPRQPNHSRVQVPWDLGPYFTVSGFRLPFLSPSRTHNATVSFSLYSLHTDYTENPVLMLCQECHTENKSCDSQSVLLECDVVVSVWKCVL